MPASTEIKNFTKEILNVFVSDLTDKVFLEIQSKPELIQKYLLFVCNKANNISQSGQSPDLRGLNSQIAQAICEMLNLDSNGKDDNKAKSSLIYIYTGLKLK